ncbi:MAG TPA: acetylornithine/succinylornithine family transaminase [Planctomycetota bacterium]
MMQPAAGLDTQAIQELEFRFTSGLYRKRPVSIVRGQGARLWDAEGREYVDCIAGHGAANVGHCHPDVVAAIQAQAARLTLCPESLPNDQRGMLQERLVGVAPPGIERVFLCNSGTEANEAAIKFARVATGRTGIVAAMRSFHGRTMGALSATWEPKYREPFEPLVPGFRHVPFNNLAALESIVDDSTAAVLLEAVQGESGVRPGTAEYLQGAEALCRERGAMFVLDEVQTGFGRTGRMWAGDHCDLQPDLVSIAKSLGGGLPMGGVLIGERVAALPSGSHGCTFGGNPLAAASALAGLDVLEREGLAERAAKLGAHAMERLRAEALPRVREVRGLGLMIGVELDEKVDPLLQALLENGVLALPAGPKVLRLLPPLVIAEAELDRALDVVIRLLREPSA